MCSRKVRRSGKVERGGGQGLPSWSSGRGRERGGWRRLRPWWRCLVREHLLPGAVPGALHAVSLSRPNMAGTRVVAGGDPTDPGGGVGAGHVTRTGVTTQRLPLAPGRRAGRGLVPGLAPGCGAPSPGPRQPAAEGAELPQRHLGHLRRLRPQPRAVSHL